VQAQSGELQAGHVVERGLVDGLNQGASLPFRTPPRQLSEYHQAQQRKNLQMRQQNTKSGIYKNA
jgi:hypothetical protein